MYCYIITYVGVADVPFNYALLSNLNLEHQRVAVRP
jgi:hypothetical protein